MHLKDTISAIMGLEMKMAGSGGKIETCVMEVIKSKGITIVTGFYDSSHYQAHNREAALIDFIGLENLTNVYNGSRYGDFADFNTIKSKNYGLLALYILFKNYVFNGATAFTLEDLCYLKEGGTDKEEVMDGNEDVNGNFCEHKCQRCSFRMLC